VLLIVLHNSVMLLVIFALSLAVVLIRQRQRRYSRCMSHVIMLNSSADFFRHRHAPKRPELSLLSAVEKRKRGELNEPELYAPTDLCGVTVADLIPRSMETGFKEEDHLQPVLVDLIQAAMHTAECDCFLHNTHLSSNQLDEPASRPDCTLVAAGNKAMWTQVVSLWEFEIGSSKTETETMFGQQIERCRYALDSYDQRQMVVAVNITMNSLDVMSVERQAKEDFKLTTTGPQPFSISKDSAGFQLLVQVLSTAKSDLGFVTPFLPNINSLEGHQFTVQSLIKQGTAHQGSGSWVFSVKLGSGADAILKLNKSPNEVSKLLPSKYTPSHSSPPLALLHPSVCVLLVAAQYSLYVITLLWPFLFALQKACLLV